MSQEDELELARAVMKELYSLAGRRLPDFFPEVPFEKTYDPGRESWRDLVFSLRKAKLTNMRQRVRIDFDGDVPDHEVTAYQASLPQTVNFTKTGRTLVVENPEEFRAWLGKKARTWPWRRRQRGGRVATQTRP